MTGGIPGFVDVVLNFGSSELKEDSLIMQWSNAGRCNRTSKWKCALLVVCDFFSPIA